MITEIEEKINAVYSALEDAHAIVGLRGLSYEKECEFNNAVPYNLYGTAFAIQSNKGWIEGFSLRIPEVLIEDGTPEEIEGVKWRASGRYWLAEFTDYIEKDIKIYPLNRDRVKYPRKEHFIRVIQALNKVIEGKKAKELQEAIEELRSFNINGFLRIKEANKYLFYRYLDEVVRQLDLIILYKYTTTCLNTTLYLHPKKEELVIPDEYKGIIIGKGGENIKRLCREYRSKFKVV